MWQDKHVSPTLEIQPLHCEGPSQLTYLIRMLTNLSSQIKLVNLPGVAIRGLHLAQILQDQVTRHITSYSYIYLWDPLSSYPLGPSCMVHHLAFIHYELNIVNPHNYPVAPVLTTKVKIIRGFVCHVPMVTYWVLWSNVSSTHRSSQGGHLACPNSYNQYELFKWPSSLWLLEIT